MDEQEPRDRDHWEIYAECVDLTIEGYRLIAQELVFEAKVAWRAVRHWVGDVSAVATRWRSAPPVR